MLAHTFLFAPPFLFIFSVVTVSLPYCHEQSLNFVAVRQLHREFQRAGADIIQAFTFSMDDDLAGDQAKYGVCIIISICLPASIDITALTCSADSVVRLQLNLYKILSFGTF